MKIVTTAAALALLGRDYAFVTRFLADGNVADGTLGGDLVVVGGGDPGISGRANGLGAASRLDEAARAIRAAGIARVTGRLVLDDRFFDRELVNAGWPRDQLGEWYCAETGALSLNDNCLDVTVSGGLAAGSPSLLAIDPSTAYVDVKNLTKTVAARAQHRYRIERKIGENRFTVTGSVLAKAPGRTDSVTVHDPTLFFGTVFREALARAGVTVGGDMIVVDRRLPYALPPGATEITRLETPLAEAVKVCNKRSQNFYAEQIVKTIGRERCGEGSWRAGLAEVGDFLERAAGCRRIPVEEFAAPSLNAPGGSRSAPDGDFFLADGSGLSAANRITPRAMTRVLDHALGQPTRREFFDSLPIGGVDASLEKRLRDKKSLGRVVAKTGYIARVSALSGYVRGEDGATYVFSILLNKFKGGNAEMKKIQDDVCRAIIDWSGARKGTE
jgi:D-alanyl-D-alanine carboxypeptidase/D-alanyl-D-alanine-endopeptidase (penicillin-binding protein 4)